MNQTKISFLHSLILFLFSFLFFGAVSVYLGQDVNWDLRNYHYYNPYAFLNGRLGFDYGPAQAQTYLNPIGLSVACAAVGMYSPGNMSLLGTTFNDLRVPRTLRHFVKLMSEYRQLPFIC